MRKLICVGNALVEGDRAGPEAHALLSRRGTPPGVALVDGGLSGLDLLGAMEGAESVVFVDSVRGFGAPGEVVVLTPEEVVEGCAGGFDHAAGLAYLLGVYEAVLPPPAPKVRLVGVEEPAGGASVEEAVRVALGLLAGRTEVADAARAS